MTRPPPRRRFPGGRPALASLLLHGGAALALAALHSADPLPAAVPERGVEIVWQDSPEDAAPGEGAEAPPESAEAPSQDAPAEAEQASAQAPPPQPPPPAPEAAPEQPFPEPPPPEADSAAAPAPELPPPIEPPPPRVVEAPLPPAAEPAVAQLAPPPEDARMLDLPLPPPAAPAPPRPAPAQETPPRAVAARQSPAGPSVPVEAAPAGSSRVAGAVSPPSLLDVVRNPEPEYPLINRQRGDQGVVLVLLRVSETGQVVEVEVVGTSGHPALDASARQAAQRWRFRPAMRDGVPTAGTVRTAIHFRLR